MLQPLTRTPLSTLALFTRNGIPSVLFTVPAADPASTILIADSLGSNNITPSIPVDVATEASTTFDPVVNMPALSSFLFIVVIFSLLQARINSVTEAAEARKIALDALRDLKRRELASSEGTSLQQEIEKAKDKYRELIDEEEKRRTIMPGIRVVAPGGTSPEDANAALQFLGIELPKQKDETEETNGLNGPAILLLATIGMSQIALLVLLSFDPVSTSQSFLGQ